jgi:hypothetical protein
VDSHNQRLCPNVAILPKFQRAMQGVSVNLKLSANCTEGDELKQFSARAASLSAA